MKKQATSDAKKRAANDVEMNDTPKAAAAKAPKAKPEERYTIGQTDTVKRGLLKEFCDFVRKKGAVTLEQLVAEFAGRTIDKHPVNAARVSRYVGYAKAHGHIKVAKNGGAK
jgi:hypothetical protein